MALCLLIHSQVYESAMIVLDFSGQGMAEQARRRDL